MSKEKSEITLKISAVIIALILWSYVMSIENPETTWEHKDIEVVFNNTEALDKNSLVIMSPKEATVSVKISGKKSDRLNSSEAIKAQVDLSGYSEGQRKVPINVTLSQSSNLKITDYEPKEILFTFDKIISIDKPVTIRTEGDLAPGYVLGDISTKSENILLRGPRTWVNEVSEIIANIKLADRKENINVTAPIKLIDDQGNNVTGVKYEPNIIDVSIPVYRTTTVPIEIQTVNELPENYEVTDININPSSVKLKGDKNIVNLRSVQTKPIDINSFIENADIVTELELPSNVSLLNPNEKITVSLKIEEAFTKTFEYTLEEIEKKNLNPELNIDLENYSQLIEITLKGKKDIIENLSKEDIELYLDFNMLEEGEQEVYLEFDVPTGVTVNNIIPQPIKLNLTKD